MPSRWVRRWSTALPSVAAIFVVLVVYVFFATAGTWRFPSVAPTDTHYANLAEGFRLGQLSMAVEPDPALKQMANPYDVSARTAGNVPFVWDASYYQGKYFLYFSPLPVLLFHLPYRLLGERYPADALPAVLFTTWSFLAAIALLRRVLVRLRAAGHAPAVPFPLWILLIGVGNLIPFTLPGVTVHILPVTLAMAFTAMWAWSLLLFWETRSASHAGWMGLWLALAVVTRPNLGVLLFLSAALLFVSSERGTRMRSFLWMLVPLVAIGALAAWYNFARFGDPLELGIQYQMNGRMMLNAKLCGLRNVPELLRLLNNVIHFVFFAPVLSSRYPFVELQGSRLDYAVSYPASEPIGGVAAVIPAVIVGTLLAVLLVSSRRSRMTEVRAGACWLAAGWLILLGVSTCGGIAPRYSLDFMTLMTMGAIVCIEAGIGFLRSEGWAVWPFRLAGLAMACYSVLLGLALGFSSAQEPWTRLNPQLLERVTRFFN